jgi:hypothetical protein
MTQKNGSPRLSAAAAVGDASENEQLDQKPRSRQAKNKDDPHVGPGNGAAGQEAHSMEPRQPSDLGRAPRGMLDRSLQAQLGRQLRAIFSDVAEEPVPERFVKLLEALEAREKRR